jgi:hypothetical protein
MPLADITWVLEQGQAACAAAGLIFSAYPFHEVAAHPEAGAVLRLFSAFPGDPSLDEGRPMFQPLSTTGVPLALRPDWAEVLATCRELGATVVWPACMGWARRTIGWCVARAPTRRRFWGLTAYALLAWRWAATSS